MVQKYLLFLFKLPIFGNKLIKIIFVFYGISDGKVRLG